MSATVAPRHKIFGRRGIRSAVAHVRSKKLPSALQTSRPSTPTISIPAQSTKRQFDTLNGLRGVAALLGVVFHNEVTFGWHPPHAYLAVEIFFVISGFILSYVYDDKMERGLSARSFMAARVLRLAPLYLLALVLSAVLVALDPRHSVHRLGYKAQLLYFVMGLFLLPSHVRQDSSWEVLRYNNPSWTLFLELVMNFLHVTLFRSMNSRVLGTINATAALGIIAYCLRHHHLNAGWIFPSLFTIGLARATFSYTAGMILFRAWRSGSVRINSSATLCVAFVMGVLILPAFPQHVMATTVAVILVALFLFPALVYLAAGSEPGPVAGPLFRQLGIASYTVYILHFPIFHLFRLLTPEHVFTRPLAGYAVIALLVALGLFLNTHYDQPARTWIRRAIDRRTARAQVDVKAFG